MKKEENAKKLIYVFAAAGAVSASLALMALFAVVVCFLDIDRRFIPFFSTLSVAGGSFISAFFTAKKVREKGYIIGAVIGITCFLLITIISFAAGGTEITLNTLFHFSIIVLSAVVGGVLGVNRGNSKKFI